MVKPINLACDWYQDLKMYQIPEQYSLELVTEFPNVSLIPVNCQGFPEYEESAQIYFGNRIKEINLKYMPDLEWVHFGSIGTDKLSPKAIKDRKLTITNSRGTMEEAVASTALSFIFTLARGQKQICLSTQQKTFGRKNYDDFFPHSNDVYGSKFCILGYGPISQLLLKALDPIAGELNIVTRTKRNMPRLNFFDYSDINNAVKEADFIVNLLPQNESTLNIVNKDVISNFKKQSYYINLGRHTTNDEESLVEAIDKKQLSGLGLDVFSGNENLKDKMFEHYNISLSPHIGAVSKDYWKKQMDLLKWNLLHYFKGDFNNMRNLIYLEGEFL